jgi:hypothetical protein
LPFRKKKVWEPEFGGSVAEREEPKIFLVKEFEEEYEEYPGPKAWAAVRG